MLKRIVFAIALIWMAGLGMQVEAQGDSLYTLSYLNKSTRFAWTTVGVDMLLLGNGSSSYLEGGLPKQVNFSPTAVPRLNIGGVHFWGHAEFNVSFPLNFLAIRKLPEGFSKLRYLPGIETSARVYPWALQPGKLRPFVGAGFRLLSYKQQFSNTSYAHGVPVYQKMVYPWQAGITYTTSAYLFSLSMQYQRHQEFPYYVSLQDQASIRVNPVTLQFGVSAYWDTDKRYRQPEEVANEHAKYRVLEKEKRLSTWYWGIGPSAGIQVSKSPYLKNNFPHLYDDFFGSFLPDLSFGRFLSKPDMNIGLSYRTMGASLNGFDDRIRLRRHSFMLEAYKNLFNYFGFVPFLGVTGSVEYLKADVNGNSYSQTKPAIGFIFGWDIRVTKTGTSLLRTNLRYVPDLHLSIAGDKLMFNQLEFNFIQWVQFIGRKKAYVKYSK